MYSIQKKFGPYPCGHRQHKHEGHCAYVHGHNWYFEITLEDDALDGNGFVYDFGKFKPFRNWLEYMFDHTLLINTSDPMFDHFVEHNGILWDMREIENGSSESIAKLVFEQLCYLMGRDSDKVKSVRVYEDEKNSATHHGKHIHS